MFSHLHPSYWSLLEWSFLTDRSGSSWRSLEFWPGRPHLSCSACTDERTCANCGWPQGQSVQTEDLRLGLVSKVRFSLFWILYRVASVLDRSHKRSSQAGVCTRRLSSSEA